MAIDIENILNKLTPEEQKMVEALLSTITMQAELIKMMSQDLEDYEGPRRENTALHSNALNRVAQLLNKPTVQGPSVQEINNAIEAMRSQIDEAQSGQEAFDAVLKFGVRVAPLFLL